MNSLTSAVAAVVTDDAGRVLLCQQSQGHRRWGLPGGKVRAAESPVHAAFRDVLEETGMDTELVDLVGIYELTGQALPDLVVHVFRGRIRARRGAASTRPAASAASPGTTPTTCRSR